MLKLVHNVDPDNYVQNALRRNYGNITETARELNIDSAWLRKLVRNTAHLQAEVEEAREQLVDRAETVVQNALANDNSAARKDCAAKFVLSAALAARREYRRTASRITIGTTAPLVITWAAE